MDDKRVASLLKGNTLRVYWCLLESLRGSLGPRGVQRKLGFSSPSLAVYHLDKLSDLGLVEKVSGEYHLTKIVEAGILKQFMKFKGVIVPRNVLYATMLTTLFVFYLTQFKEVNFYSIFGLIFGLLGSSILWFETIRVWRSKP
ncbi:MAG: hypothetical protein JSV75_02255 [Candidatus Bathyarchaeota archaeon]|nr:MAG: hypothetical protein JSV75_02255 [Candidatus Bathyarchaeota archaeon]